MSTALLDSYRGRRVLVTGHTGFKGSWLATWLQMAGARVAGFALPVDSGGPSLFDAIRVGDGMVSVLGDIRDLKAVSAVFDAHAPEVVFHLAAQSLVRRSYSEPVVTYATNVLGTVHVLEAARRARSVRAVVVVTSDKCYENQGTERAYREDDPMGGYDPYSSSKGCAELVTTAYRRSYFQQDGPAIASARAGNVIGGGDWAEDRLVPDLVRGAVRGEAVVIRSPHAIRPWQHVLDPLRGYLLLGRALLERGRQFADAWNFGPDDAEAATVEDVVARIRARWERVRVVIAEAPSGPHEAKYLTLDSTKARRHLGWASSLSLDEAVAWTIDWYRASHDDPSAAPALIRTQIEEYEGRVSAVRGN